MTDPKPDMTSIRDTSIQLKCLLIAADKLFGGISSTESGPIEAILRSALVEARKLDTMIDQLCDDAAT